MIESMHNNQNNISNLSLACSKYPSSRFIIKNLLIRKYITNDHDLHEMPKSDLTEVLELDLDCRKKYLIIFFFINNRSIIGLKFSLFLEQ